MNQEEITTLRMAVNEINHLRQTNEIQSARLKMFDDCMLLFKCPPPYNGTGMMHPDVAYELAKLTEKMILENPLPKPDNSKEES